MIPDSSSCASPIHDSKEHFVKRRQKKQTRRKIRQRNNHFNNDHGEDETETEGDFTEATEEVTESGYSLEDEGSYSMAFDEDGIFKPTTVIGTKPNNDIDSKLIKDIKQSKMAKTKGTCNSPKINSRRISTRDGQLKTTKSSHVGGQQQRRIYKAVEPKRPNASYHSPKRKQVGFHSATEQRVFNLDGSLLLTEEKNEESDGEKLRFCVEIISCRNLSTVVIGDNENETSLSTSNHHDPYVKVRVGKKFIHKTKHVRKTRNPVYTEDKYNICCIEVALEDLRKAGGLGFKVKDWGKIGYNDEIGDVIIPAETLSEAQHGDPIEYQIRPPSTEQIKRRMSWNKNKKPGCADSSTSSIRNRRQSRIANKDDAVTASDNTTTLVTKSPPPMYMTVRCRPATEDDINTYGLCDPFNDDMLPDYCMNQSMSPTTRNSTTNTSTTTNHRSNSRNLIHQRSIRPPRSRDSTMQQHNLIAPVPPRARTKLLSQKFSDNPIMNKKENEDNDDDIVAPPSKIDAIANLHKFKSVRTIKEKREKAENKIKERKGQGSSSRSTMTTNRDKNEEEKTKSTQQDKNDVFDLKKRNEKRKDAFKNNVPKQPRLVIETVPSCLLVDNSVASSVQFRAKISGKDLEETKELLDNAMDENPCINWIEMNNVTLSVSSADLHLSQRITKYSKTITKICFYDVSILCSVYVEPPVLQCLCKLPKLEELEIRMRDRQELSYPFLISFLENAPSVKSLVLWNVLFDFNQLKLVYESFVANRKIERFELWKSDAGNEEKFAELTGNMLRFNTKLESMVLSHIGLKGDNCTALATALQFNQTIKELALLNVVDVKTAFHQAFGMLTRRKFSSLCITFDERDHQGCLEQFDLMRRTYTARKRQELINAAGPDPGWCPIL